MRWIASVVIALGLLPSAALADGKRDLDDGIAFYDNLDIERARARLTSASQAQDLSDKDRARAFLYLGMLDFELGDAEGADTSFVAALRLDKNVVVPEGTSPKTKIAIARVKSSLGDEEPGGVKPPPPPAPPPPPVDLNVPPPPPPPSEGVTHVTELPPPDDEGISPWVWVGVGAGVVAVAAVVAIIVIGGSGSACERGDGGCLVVEFQ